MCKAARSNRRKASRNDAIQALMQRKKEKNANKDLNPAGVAQERLCIIDRWWPRVIVLPSEARSFFFLSFVSCTLTAAKERSKRLWHRAVKATKSGRRLLSLRHDHRPAALLSSSRNAAAARAAAPAQCERAGNRGARPAWSDCARELTAAQAGF